MKSIRSIVAVFFTSVLLATTLLTQSLGAQSLGVRTTAEFADAVDVEVVNLEVYVTDRKGNPITDLDRDDFELFANGQATEVTNFYTVNDGRRMTRGDASEADSGAAADPVFLAVFVDNAHVGQFTRNRLLEELRGFLKERIHRQDQVMLVSFDGGMRVHHTFTRDWNVVEAGLDAVASEPSYGHLREQERLGVLQNLMALRDAAFRPRCPDEFDRMADSYAREAYARVHASVSGLKEFVGTLSSLPGRKALLYVSDGLPFQPGIGVYEFLYQYCGGGGEVFEADMVGPTDVGQNGTSDAEIGDATGNSDASGALGVSNPAFNTTRVDPRQAALMMTNISATSLLDELTRLANAHRVTFFPIEAYGPRTYSSSDVRTRERRTLSRHADEARWASLRDSLNNMADETGGRALIDTARFAPALDRVGQDLGTYYSLGYRLPKSSREQGDEEQAFRVAVKVDRPGVRVRHRKWLRSQSLASELAGRTQAALIYGVVDNPLGVVVATGPTQPMGDDRHIVPVRVSIPLGKITLLPEADDHRGHLKLFLAGRDRNGRLADVRTAEIPIRIPTSKVETARGQLYLYEIKMLMRQGEHTVAVGLHDEIGAVASFVAGPVTVAWR